MQRGITQVLFKYLPEATFRFDDRNIWCKVNEVTLRNAKPLNQVLKVAVRSLLVHWGALESQGGTYPDPLLKPTKYICGEPLNVNFDLFPLVFKCKYCNRVYYYKDVKSLSKNPDLMCSTCRRPSSLVQLPYIFIHECGHIDSIYLPKHPPNPAKKEEHPIKIDDRRSFRNSQWVCGKCGPLGTNGLGFRRCKVCGGGLMRGTVLQDSKVYYAHTVGLLDIGDEDYVHWCHSDDATNVLLAGYCNTEGYTPDLLLGRKDKEIAVFESTESSEEEFIRQTMKEEGFSDELIEAIIQSARIKKQQKQIERERPSEWIVNTFPKEIIDAVKESSQISEFLFVRDHPKANTISVNSLLAQAIEKDSILEKDLYQNTLRGMDELGIKDLRITSDLPMVLAAVGYSRYSYEKTKIVKGKKISARLRLFPRTRENKFPVYIAKKTTEALAFSLDPFRWSAWLLANNFIEEPEEKFQTEQDVWAWLLKQMPAFLHKDHAYLNMYPWETEYETQNLCCAMSFGLLHSLSHALLRASSQYVGFDTDSLGEYLFPVAGSGLIYASSYKNFTLGGLVSVFYQDMLMWLKGAKESAYKCMLDPLCHERGGGCHACLYLKFSCRHFNRNVSRSFLIGGKVKGYQGQIVGYWSPEIKRKAEEIKERIRR